MNTNSYNSLSNFIIRESISTSVLSLSYDSDSFIPKKNHDYHFHNNIVDWKNNAFNFNLSFEYQLHDLNSNKIQTIVDFSNKILNNSKDIESEYVDIVNASFWELI